MLSPQSHPSLPPLSPAPVGSTPLAEFLARFEQDHRLWCMTIDVCPAVGETRRVVTSAPLGRISVSDRDGPNGTGALRVYTTWKAAPLVELPGPWSVRSARLRGLRDEVLQIDAADATVTVHVWPREYLLSEHLAAAAASTPPGGGPS